MTGHRYQRGQVLVEFAFAASVFLTLVFAIIEFSSAIYQYDVVGQAARLGTRYASVNTLKPASDCGTAGGTCQTAILTYLANKTGLDASKFTSATTITYSPGSPSTCSNQPTVGCTVTIVLQYPFSFIGLPIAPITLTSTSQAVLNSAGTSRPVAGLSSWIARRLKFLSSHGSRSTTRCLLYVANRSSR